MRMRNGSNRLESLGIWSPMVLLALAACASSTTPTESNSPPGSEAGAASTSGSSSGSPASTSGSGATSGIPTTGPSSGTNTAGSGTGASGQTSGSDDASVTTASDSGPVATGDGGGPAQKSAGCGMAKPATVETSIMVGSMSGNITVDVPTNYDENKAYPLVLVWHGFGVTGTAFHGYLDIHTAVGNNAIVVTPECLGGGSAWPSDMSYPDALLAHFEASYCIDKNRLFTTGHSMGGAYTGLIGCERGDVFRGDAVLAAPHPEGSCKKGTMAVYMGVGSADPTGTMPSVEFPWWAMENGCNYSMTTMVNPMAFYSKALDESGVCLDYGGCGALTALRTCTFTGGHEIPPWEAGAIWNFFQKL